MSTHTTEPDHAIAQDDEQTDEQYDLSSEPAPDAQACVALGCTATEDLARADHPSGDGSKRVVCPEHLADLWRADA